MVDLLLAMGVPTAGFGLFALIAYWAGAESRPWFDERPVLDERPNWFPLSRRPPKEPPEEDDEDDEPRGGTPVPVAAPVRRRQPARTAPARAATSPSGV